LAGGRGAKVTIASELLISSLSSFSYLFLHHIPEQHRSQPGERIGLLQTLAAVDAMPLKEEGRKDEAKYDACYIGKC
jgi:hypothetical protein